MQWGLTIRIAVPVALLAALGPLLSIELMLQGYDTAIPLQTFQATMYIVILMSVVFGFLLTGGAVALLTSFYSESMAALRRANRRLLGLDAAVALLATIGIGLLLHQIQALLLDRFHAQALFSVANSDLIVNKASALVAIADAVRSTLFSGAMLGTIAPLIAGRLSRTWMKAPGGSAGGVHPFASGYTDARGNWPCNTESRFDPGGCVATFARDSPGNNYLAYALVLWVLAFRGPLGELFGTSIPALHLQGWIAVAILAASVLWAVLPAMTGKPPSRRRQHRFDGVKPVGATTLTPYPPAATDPRRLL